MESLHKQYSHHIFLAGEQYFNMVKASKGGWEDCPNAFASNCAFSIEQYLKSLCSKEYKNKTHKEGTLLSQSEIGSDAWGHNLYKIFLNIEVKTQNFLMERYEELSNRSLKKDLKKYSNYFVSNRYPYEIANRKCVDLSGIYDCAAVIRVTIKDLTFTSEDVEIALK